MPKRRINGTYTYTHTHMHKCALRWEVTWNYALRVSARFDEPPTPQNALSGRTRLLCEYMYACLLVCRYVCLSFAWKLQCFGTSVLISLVALMELAFSLFLLSRWCSSATSFTPKKKRTFKRKPPLQQHCN